MGNIQDPHHPKHKRKARGHQKDQHSIDQPMDRLNEIDRCLHEDFLSKEVKRWKTLQFT
jgi:hypothetical protein